MKSKSKLYYNASKYKSANDLFNHFIDQCDIITPPRSVFDDFQVSTITCVSTIGKMVNIQKFFDELDITTSPDIVYAKYSHCLKGIKKKTKKIDATKLRGNNQLFTNQMSIGFRCNDPRHLHKNPISVKVFRNGRIQMTGCKNMDEIQIMYGKLHDELSEIQKKHEMHQIHEEIEKTQHAQSENNEHVENNDKNDKNDKNNDEMIVEDLLQFEVTDVQIEMINGTFYVNESLNLNQVLKMFMQEYSHQDVFIIQNKKSPLNLSVKMLGYFDEKKQKDKIPSVFIYNTGAINIIATKQPILMKTYEFIKSNLEKWWDRIVETKIVYNSEILKKSCATFNMYKIEHRPPTTNGRHSIL